MNIQREWATPMVAGAFFLSAITGVLIFFHLDSGFNKPAHEWLSWALLAGAILHVTTNFQGLKRYFKQKPGQSIMGAFVVLLLLSFINLGKEAKPPFIQPVQALANASLVTLAEVAKVSPEEVTARLAKAGYQVTSTQQSVKALAGNDLGKQMQALNAVLTQ